MLKAAAAVSPTATGRSTEKLAAGVGVGAGVGVADAVGLGVGVPDVGEVGPGSRFLAHDTATAHTMTGTSGRIDGHHTPLRFDSPSTVPANAPARSAPRRSIRCGLLRYE
jgi:hypothetical protein